MSMPGLKKSVFRLVGMVLNLVAIILIVIGNFVAYIHLLFADISVVVGIGLIVLFLKLELDFIDDNRMTFLLASLFAFGVLCVIGNAITFVYASTAVIFSIFFIIQLFLPVMWHYTLSIYKKEKKTFVIIFIVSEVYFIVFDFISGQLNILLIIAQVVLLAAFLMVILVEKDMKDKKLLTYI